MGTNLTLLLSLSLSLSPLEQSFSSPYQGDGWHDNSIVLKRLDTNKVVADCTLTDGWYGICAVSFESLDIDSSENVPFVLKNIDTSFSFQNAEIISRGIAHGVCNYARNSAMIFVDNIQDPVLVCSLPLFRIHLSDDVVDVSVEVRFSSTEVVSYDWEKDINLLRNYIYDELTDMFPANDLDSMILEYEDGRSSGSSSGLSKTDGIVISVFVATATIVLAIISYFTYSRGYCFSNSATRPRRLPKGMIELKDDAAMRAVDIVDVDDNPFSNDKVATLKIAESNPIGLADVAQQTTVTL